MPRGVPLLPAANETFGSRLLAPEVGVSKNLDAGWSGWKLGCHMMGCKDTSTERVACPDEKECRWRFESIQEVQESEASDLKYLELIESVRV